MHVKYFQEVKQNYLGRIGMLLLIGMFILAVLAPFLTPYSPTGYSVLIFHPPGPEHWLGTNDVGQDIWTRLLYGARTSLLIGCGTALTASFFSLAAGGAAALLGSWVARVLMRLVDILLVIPPVIVVILVAAYYWPHVFLVIFLLSLFLWPGGAWLVRAQVLSLKESRHVAAARTFGAGWLYIMRRHIIPELGPILIAIMIQDARRAIFMEAGLSFLGISDPTVISWGKMMQNALKFYYLEVWKWWLLPTGFALSLTIMGFTFTGTALETVLNPRLRKEVGHAGD